MRLPNLDWPWTSWEDFEARRRLPRWTSSSVLLNWATQGKWTNAFDLLTFLKSILVWCIWTAAWLPEWFFHAWIVISVTSLNLTYYIWRFFFFFFLVLFFFFRFLKESRLSLKILLSLDKHGTLTSTTTLMNDSLESWACFPVRKWKCSF